MYSVSESEDSGHFYFFMIACIHVTMVKPKQVIDPMLSHSY